LRNIRRYVPDDILVGFGGASTTATDEAVAFRLSDVSVVHFACHGKQDRVKLLDSGHVLEGWLLSASRIMKEKLPNGSLALCACETAMWDETLPDETMNLGASLLFFRIRPCGCYYVVGSIVIIDSREIMDELEDGPTIADTSYEEILMGPGLRKLSKYCG